MDTRETHYPGYDVTAAQEHWDAYTREIVLKRLGPFPKKRFLNDHEERMLRVIMRHLVYDDREDIFDWIAYFIDERLHTEIGEHHRKPTAPPEKVLVRDGLKAIDNLSKTLHNKDFVSADTKEQFAMLAALQMRKAASIPDWAAVPQRDLFDKLLGLVVSAYYSHPAVWSEIGYGGPAYPRGYYRIELGFIDPWEAKRKDTKTQGFDGGEVAGGE